MEASGRRRRQSLRSSTREELAVAHLAVSVFAVRFAHIQTRGIRFLRQLAPSIFYRPSLLPLAFFFLSFSFLSSTLLLFFLPWLFAFSAFSSNGPWTPAPRPSPLVSHWSASASCVSLPPFFVKASDTLIRCVVLFAFLRRGWCFARSRCNCRLYLSSRGNMSYNAAFLIHPNATYDIARK